MFLFPKANKKFTGSRRGNIAPIILAVVGVTTLLGVFSFIMKGKIDMTARKVKQTRFNVQSFSGIETMLLAFRAAEMKYISEVAPCGISRPFVDALKNGSGCTNPAEIQVFYGTDAGTDANLYSYPGAGCTIRQNTSTCATGQTEILNIGVMDPTEKFDNISWKFFLIAVVPQKSLVEFTVNSLAGTDTTESRNAFAIRGSLPNAAHLEADGRVTQENPDPLAKCPGSPWADYYLFDSNSNLCKRFSQFGSGTGLAYYRERYFGFRPFDGQVIDLSAELEGLTSYMVNEDGTIDPSIPRFPAYNKDILINVDDITLISDQIYYVANSGDAAHIGAIKYISGAWERVEICALGSMGWSQSYAGIVALSWSDPMLPVTGDGLTSRFATFYLKTSSGDLLTAVVTKASDIDPYTCSVFKDSNLQVDEYKRTDGFDRTATSKPYYLY